MKICKVKSATAIGKKRTLVTAADAVTPASAISSGVYRWATIYAASLLPPKLP